jgi:Ca-activated chloride channel family protein
MRFPAGRTGRARGARLASASLGFALATFALGPSVLCRAQENPLDNVLTPTPPPPPKSADSSTEAQRPALEGRSDGVVEGALHGDARMRVDVNLVRVPTTVTDPLNRIVTGLEKENFAVSDDNVPQTIRYFSSEDAPITIGVVFDLSGSMASKFVRARKALTEFLRTSNPQDEFFVVGFNDRPSIIVDYTSDPDDVEARMVMLKPENRTALIDAVYLGIDHLRQAKYDRKALLIISDGGDNRSRYTESELERVVRESGVQVYAIGIFDNYAPSTEEQMGPELLKEICEMTGGRLFDVGNDTAGLEDIAERISAELRNQYVLGYTPSEVKRDGSWRKLKVKLTPPPGLPILTVHFRDGYYAPSQ